MASTNVSNGEEVVIYGNHINGNWAPPRFVANSGGLLLDQRTPSNLLSNGDGRSEDGDHTELVSNGVDHGEEPSSDDTTDSSEQTSADGFRLRAMATVFPVPAHAWIHHGQTHPQENEPERRIRIPDGRQFFTAVLTIRFRDTQIVYSRTFASMSSMTLLPAHNAGLHADDFEHLYRLISIRFNYFVTCLDAVTQQPLPPNNAPALSSYTAEVSLSTGENPVRTRSLETFHNHGPTVIGPENARFVTVSLEEIILSAIETIDDLADYRLGRRVAADYERRAIIPEFEARRAFARERGYQTRIAQLEESLRERARERDGGSGGGGVEWDPLRTRAEGFHPRSGGSHSPSGSAGESAGESANW